jgi:CheY-like chemotaxis protein
VRGRRDGQSRPDDYLIRHVDDRRPRFSKGDGSPVGASNAAGTRTDSHSKRPARDIYGYLQCAQSFPGTTLDGAMSLRLLIVDDNVHFLDAARGLLDSDGMSVVGVATTSADGLRLAVELRPDVALVDIDLGEDSGFDLARRLMAGEFASEQQVILTSAYPEEDFAELINTSPAIAFVPKSELSPGAIVELIRRHRIDRDPDTT